MPAISLVAARVSWASFLTSAATTANERPASPARAASMVAFKASMLVLLAIVSMLEETFWTWVIASAKPAMRSPSWTTRSVSPEKMAIVSSIAFRPWSNLPRACSARTRASSVESDTCAWSASSRVVTSSSESSIFKLAEIRSLTPAT